MAAHGLSQAQVARKARLSSAGPLSRWLGYGRDRLSAASQAEVAGLLAAYLDEYTASVGPMPLVFFPDAIEHICRLARILSAPRGSAMLVGVGGSGKQSLTRFAAFISGQQCVQIELRKGYSHSDFRDDLRAMYTTAGADGVDLTFLFCDSQV